VKERGERRKEQPQRKEKKKKEMTNFTLPNKKG
jgi:hypothetical protein